MKPTQDNYIFNPNLLNITFRHIVVDSQQCGSKTKQLKV